MTHLFSSTLPRLATLLFLCGAFLFQSPAVYADLQTAKASVVSVLPVWPGRAQAGNGGPPGVAPEGSGVVIDPNLIVTAWHVIEPAESVSIRLHSGRIIPTEVHSYDPLTDLALLKIEEPLPPIEVAHEVSLAEPVCALGNAFGLGVSLTCGVVSATGVTNALFNDIEDFIQTDTALNPGMSGGALVNQAGQLVGISSAIFASEDGTNTGVSFAVSAQLMTRVLDDLADDGVVRFIDPGWTLQSATREERVESSAPIVMDVKAGGLADQHGILSGDRIVQIGDRALQSPRDAIAAMALLPPDTQVFELKIKRGDQEQALALPVSDQQISGAPGQSSGPASSSGNEVECPHTATVCQVRQAVFPVSAYDPIASATRISEDLLITNRHVVGDRGEATVHTPNGSISAQVIPSAYLGDLILLRAEGLPEGAFIPERSSDAEANTRFYAVGADVARQLVRVFNPGELILSPSTESELSRLHVSAQMQPGVSGGALVNDDGLLVGIAVGGGDGRFEAIPIAQVEQLLEQRTADNAAELTQHLGESYVACDQSLDQMGSQSEYDAILGACSDAMNAGQLLEAGRLLARQNSLSGAVELHNQAVQQTPHSINARLSLLVSLQLSGRFDEMIEHANWLLETAPNDPQALRFSIQSGVWGGDLTLAERGYQALLQADPRQADAARRFIDEPPPAPPKRP